MYKQYINRLQYFRKAAAAALLALGIMSLTVTAFAADYYTLANVHLRAADSTQSESLAMLGEGTAVTVTEYVPDGWSKVSYNGIDGYVKSEFLKTRPGVIYYALAGVNFRSEPTAESACLMSLPKGTAVTVTEYDPYGWSKISHNGTTGYIKSEFLGSQGEALAGTYYTLAKVNLRTAASTESESVMLIDSGEKVEVTCFDPDGWSAVIYDGKSGFIKTAFLGNGKQPEKASLSARPGNVELTPWSEAKNIFKTGVDACVYDVYTGITYTVRSFSNGKHADVEPVTKNDTELLKQTFDGVWKWAVRPVWVTVGGKTMAASISGMPHGGGVIGGNGMNGQVCIHFKGSSTHNGNASFTELHQKKALEAYNLSLQ